VRNHRTNTNLPKFISGTKKSYPFGGDIPFTNWKQDQKIDILHSLFAQKIPFVPLFVPITDWKILKSLENPKKRQKHKWLTYAIFIT